MASLDDKSVEHTTLPPQGEAHHGAGDAGASSDSLGRDVATKLVGEHAQEIDPFEEARVLRKIDWFLIPAMIVGAYFDPVQDDIAE
jgi:hypothetical protein